MRRSHRSRRGARRVESRLQVESLEGRVVLAASAGIQLSKGVLRITGSEGNDVAQVLQASKKTISVTLTGVATRTFRTADVKSIVFNGLGGDDTFVNNTAIRSRADGGAGADTLRGGRSADDLRGGGDDDQLFGNGGDDFLSGGDGDDFADGGAGNDREFGDDGDDELRGGPGRDTLRGGADDDDLHGGDDNDDLDGEDGDDYLDGERGDDRVHGGRGLDREDDDDDGFDDGDSDGDGYDDDHDSPVDPGLATPIVFLPADAAPETAQTAQFTGTSAGERDKAYYSFTAPAGKSTLTVTVLPDANGKHAEVEIEAGLTGQELLELEPQEDGVASAQMSVTPGTLYVITIESPFDHAAVGYTVDLRLDNSPVTPVTGTEIVLDATGFASLAGTVAAAGEKIYTFTPTAAGTMAVTLLPVDGRYAKVEVEDRATSIDVLELEPSSRGGRTSGTFAVVAGRTYVFEIESPFETASVGYQLHLQMS